MDFKEISSSNRKSIKRSIARFCFKNSVSLTEEEFRILVRRTQDSGYRSAIKFLSKYFKDINMLNSEIRKNLFSFTIEYNIENYCKQFPSGNKAVERILSGIRLPEDERFFKKTLFDIVKANKIQIEIIDYYLRG